MESQKKWINLLLMLEGIILVLVCIYGMFVYLNRDPSSQGGNEVQQDSSALDGDETEEEDQSQSDEEESDDVEMPVFSEEVEAKLASMKLEEKAAQLFVVTPEQLTGVDRVVVAGNTSKEAMKNYPVGGLIYGSSHNQGQVQFRDLISGFHNISQDTIGLPLFVAGNGLPESVYDYGIDFLGTADEAQSKLICKDFQEREESQSKAGEAAIEALKEGYGILYHPIDFKATYEAVLTAVQDGDLELEYVDRALGHILTWKMESSEQ